MLTAFRSRCRGHVTSRRNSKLQQQFNLFCWPSTAAASQDNMDVEVATARSEVRMKNSWSILVGAVRSR